MQDRDWVAHKLYSYMKYLSYVPTYIHMVASLLTGYVRLLVKWLLQPLQDNAQQTSKDSSLTINNTLFINCEFYDTLCFSLFCFCHWFHGHLDHDQINLTWSSSCI